MREYRAKNKKKIAEYQKQYDANHYYQHRERIINNKKNYYQNNKEQILIDRQQYYLEHKEKRKEYNHQYYRLNRIKILKIIGKYRLHNLKNIQFYQNAYQKKRRLNNIAYRLHTTISANVRHHLRLHQLSKNNISVIKYLNYSIHELKKHLESQFEPWMNWGNYGVYCIRTWRDDVPSTWTWQIDHLVPKSKFQISSINSPEFQQCWSLENLRPLSSKQNVIDGNRK